MRRLPNTDYQTLAEFRYRIREFLSFSEAVARSAGLTTQQHQLLLAIKGLPEGVVPTIGALAERLYLKHHTTVELVDRLCAGRYLKRESDPKDGRQVLLSITPRGEEILGKLTAIHRTELESAGPLLLKTLKKLLQDSK